MHTLKLGLLLFWAAWFCIVFLTNLFSGLKAAAMLPASWKFASKNYDAVVKAVSLYRAPAWVPKLLFAAVVIWQFAAASLYVVAFASSYASGVLQAGFVNAAFTVGISLWAAFMLADEITIKYGYEQSHELLFMAQLVSLGAIYLLP